MIENGENKGCRTDEGALRANVLKLLVESSELSRQVNRGRLDLLVRHFSEVMKMDFDFYVGDTYEEDSNTHRPSLPIDTACFGEYYFDIFDIQTVVENLNYWYERYGSIEAIRQEVIDWYYKALLCYHLLFFLVSPALATTGFALPIVLYFS